jgi:plastocyanin
MQFWVTLGVAIMASLHAFAQTRTVEVGSFFFRDGYSRTSETVIDVGTSVTWTWVDGFHTTTSVAGLWDAPINTSNRTFTFTFGQVGDYQYFCRPHSFSMRGVVKVRLPGDVDFNECIDDADLLAVLFNFGATGPRYQDVNYDGVVDDADLLIVLFNFGNGC